MNCLPLLLCAALAVARVHLATRDIGLTTHVTDVVNEILFENLRDVVLVGHSYGGMVISGVAERAPALVKILREIR